MTDPRPLGSYLRWHARESFGRALVAPLIFLALAGIPLWAFRSSEPGVSLRDPGAARDFAINIYRTFFAMGTLLGSIVMVNQVPALDRERQFFRFIFANQVAPWHYYLQRFLVAYVLFVAGAALIPLGFSTLVTDVPIVGSIQAAAILGLLIGALTLLCGALTQRDGVALIVALIATSVLQQVAKAEQLPEWLEPIVSALPPVTLSSEMRAAWVANQAVLVGDVFYVVGYSLALLVVALVVIKRFPLVR